MITVCYKCSLFTDLYFRFQQQYYIMERKRRKQKFQTTCIFVYITLESGWEQYKKEKTNFALKAKSLNGMNEILIKSTSYSFNSTKYFPNFDDFRVLPGNFSM